MMQKLGNISIIAQDDDFVNDAIDFFEEVCYNGSTGFYFVGEVKTLNFYTIQPLNILNQLALGRYVCDTDKSEFIWEWGFKDAYDWMVEQMVDRIGAPPEGVEYPVWAFADTGDAGWRSGAGVPGEIKVRIDFEMDENCTVISDFDDWHCVLNDFPLFDSDEEYDAFEELDSWTQGSVKCQSWEKIFRAHADKGSQVTFWELKLESVTGVTLFVVSEDKEEI